MSEPTREEVDGMAGPVVLEFGADWCPHCQAIRPFMADLLGNAAVPLTVWPIVFGGALLAWALIEGIALLAWRGHEVPEDPS